MTNTTSMAGPALRPPVILLGGSGQIGRAFQKVLRLSGAPPYVVNRAQADLARPETLRQALLPIIAARLASGAQRADQPSFIVINCAAYTDVDRAESDFATAWNVNAESPGVLADLCLELGGVLVHFSTDYVFDGKLKRPYFESDPVGPLSAYGRTKLGGEKAVISKFYAKGNRQHFIFRTSWVYDADLAAPQKNFFKSMLRIGQEREVLRVVGDQVGIPNYAPHLASAAARTLTAALSSTPFSGGVFHLSATLGTALGATHGQPIDPNYGEVSWHQFAETIFAELRLVNDTHPSPHALANRLRVHTVEKITSAEYASPSVRPDRSTLDPSKLETTFAVTVPSWRDGLKEAILSL